MPGLPCDGDGVCMVCRGANPPEVVLLRCSTCATPWHSPCLSKPPALADAASWRCPDCSPDSSPAPAPSGPGNDLVTAVRAIEAEETLSDQEKAPRRQALFAGSASAAADEDDDTADDALEIVGKNFSCVFTVSGPQGASDGCATLATKDMARKIGTIPYSVNQFIRIVSCFDDERKTRIKELGFESMLGLKPVKMRKNLLNCLIDLYDPVEESVTFGSGESFTVYPYDVDVIMGLKDEGTLVLLDENISPDVIPKEYKVNSTRKVISIREIITIMEQEGPPTEEFDRSFVLFVLATILAPTPKEVVPISYYSLVTDVSKIKTQMLNGEGSPFSVKWRALRCYFLRHISYFPRHISYFPRQKVTSCDKKLLPATHKLLLVTKSYLLLCASFC